MIHGMDTGILYINYFSRYQNGKEKEGGYRERILCSEKEKNC